MNEKSGGKIGLLDDIETVEQIYCSYKGAPWWMRTTISSPMIS